MKFYVAASGALLLLFGVSFLVGFQTQIGSDVPKAFTAWTRMVQLDGEGRSLHVWDERYARRADGAQVEITDAADGGAGGTRTITDAMARVSKLVDPLTRSVSTTYLSPNTATTTPRQCGTQGSQDVLFGHKVFKNERSQPAPSGRQVHHESWVAPDLNCFAIRTIETTIDTNGIVVSSLTRETVSLSIGEPAQDLFIVPEDYTERSPSQVRAEHYRVKGEPCSGCDSSAPVIDSRYFAGRGVAANGAPSTTSSPGSSKSK